MEETLAEGSQDMKPEQSWISEKLETVAVVNCLKYFKDFMFISQVVVYLEEHRQNIFYLVLSFIIIFPFNISVIGSLLPCHLCTLHRTLHALLLYVRAHRSQKDHGGESHSVIF